MATTDFTLPTCMESRRKFGQYKERVNNRGLKSTPQENIEDAHNRARFFHLFYVHLLVSY